MKTFIPPIFTFIYLICCLSNGDKLYADTGQQKNDIILLPNGMVNSISTNYKSTDKICKTITKELSFINLLKEIYDKNEVVSEEEDKNDEAKEEEQIFCDGQTCDQCSAIYDGVSLDPCRIEYVSLFCNGKDYPNSCMTEENGVDKLTEIPQTCNRIDPMGCDKFYVQKDGFQDNGCTKRKCDGGELEKTSITESICDSGLRTDLYNYGISFKIKTIVVFSDYQALQDKLNDQTIVHELYDASDPTTNDPSTQPTRSPILPTTSPISVLNNGCDLFSTKNKLTRPGGDKIRIDKSIIYVDDYSNVSLRGDINDDGLGSLSADATVNDISDWNEPQPSACYTKINTIFESLAALKGSSSTDSGRDIQWMNVTTTIIEFDGEFNTFLVENKDLFTEFTYTNLCATLDLTSEIFSNKIIASDPDGEHKILIFSNDRNDEIYQIDSYKAKDRSENIAKIRIKNGKCDGDEQHELLDYYYENDEDDEADNVAVIYKESILSLSNSGEKHSENQEPEHAT
eukprot:741806_1